MGTRFHLGEKKLDLLIEVLSVRVHGHTDGVVCGAAKRLASPVGTLVEAGSNFYTPSGINLVDAAGFRVVAYGRWVARDGQEVAHSSDAPGTEQGGLQPDEILIARGHVGHGLDPPRLKGSGEHQRIHADPRESAAIDIDRIHAAARGDLVDLLEDALERDTLRRIA